MGGRLTALKAGRSYRPVFGWVWLRCEARKEMGRIETEIDGSVQLLLQECDGSFREEANPASQRTFLRVFI